MDIILIALRRISLLYFCCFRARSNAIVELRGLADPWTKTVIDPIVPAHVTAMNMGHAKQDRIKPRSNQPTYQGSAERSLPTQQ